MIRMLSSIAQLDRGQRRRWRIAYWQTSNVLLDLSNSAVAETG